MPRRLQPVHLLLSSALAALLPTALVAQSPPCIPCAGVLVEEPTAIYEALASSPTVEGDARLYVAWPAELDGSARPEPMEEIAQRGGTPWVVLQLRTPSPVLENVEALERELEEVARLAAAAGERSHFQIDWQPASGMPDAGEHAFVLKRVAVAVTGGRSDARVLAGPYAADPAWLRALYAEDVAAYLDGLALEGSALAAGDLDRLAAATGVIRELDPGKPIVLDALPWPDDPSRTLAESARAAAAGFAVTLFDRPQPSAADLAPLKVLAEEFQGDLSYDSSSTPSGPEEAWTFVRGEDLSLRVIATTPAGLEQASFFFSDPQLRSPATIDLTTGESLPSFRQERTARGLVVPVDQPGPTTLLRLERMTAAELEGIEERVEVATDRGIPVEEILRRLQAVEDAQARRIDHYQATSTMHLRFGTGVNSFEATFVGPFFFRQGEGFDWAWRDFYVQGVKWRGKKLPELPLVQPEKAAALPLEILFTKEYAYRLRGTATVEGRDTWVVDFEPVAGQDAKGLYQGTVWIDRDIYARVKTRALQLGLEGDVISNEETTYFQPLDAQGQPAPWSTESYFLPTRVVGQQLLSVLNATTQIEKETLLEAVIFNQDGFEEARKAVLDSEVTMVRDTDKGLRYLVKEDDGTRVVQEEFDVSRTFLLGGLFYDESLDFPLPLAGINFLSFDFKGTGKQVNLFFAGALVVGNIAEPRLFGSRWDAGANIFSLFVKGSDQQFRGGIEQPNEEIENRPFSFSTFLGRPLGAFGKLDFTYRLDWDVYGRTDDTDPDFVLPEDTITHAVGAEVSYKRAGYSLQAEGFYHTRQDWAFWGLPGNTEFDQGQEDFITWGVSAGKTWWLPRFQKFGLELEILGGEDLDRFSKYDFSFFGDASVAGYASGVVRAEEASALHLTYGLNLGELLRVEVRGDAAWASDEASGLEDELLAGVSLNGTVIGPWQTIVNFDLGIPVEGPADGLVAYLVFLKLWK